jgi:hypothetical protein
MLEFNKLLVVACFTGRMKNPCNIAKAIWVKIINTPNIRALVLGIAISYYRLKFENYRNIISFIHLQLKCSILNINFIHFNHILPSRKLKNYIKNIKIIILMKISIFSLII